MTRTVLTGGRVFDGTGSPVADADVAISEGKIVDVGPGLDGDEQVDVQRPDHAAGLLRLPRARDGLRDRPGATPPAPFLLSVLPGGQNLEATLDCGITTMRDAGGADLGVQRAVKDGLLDGPRLQISISALSQTGGPRRRLAPLRHDHLPHVAARQGARPAWPTGPRKLRKRVREIIRAGANVIKVHTSGGVLSPRDNPKHAQFRPDELSALMAEAAAAGLPVMAHAQATDGIKNALRAGVRSIEHGIYLDDEAIEMMLAPEPGWSRPWSRRTPS